MATATTQQKTVSAERELQCINLLRFLSVDMIQKANSGHPGLPLGAAPMATVLFQNFMRFNPKNPNWFNRDRFVLSAGHGSALLYSLLYATGYDLSLDDLKKFRQFGSKTAGHPERNHAPGVEITTGPLGQGFANGVGFAIAEAHLAAVFNRPQYNLFDHYTYAIVSDGDLMEGVAAEAASLAGHLKLGKLIYLYDSNNITLSAATDLTFTEDVQKRFESYDWQVLHVKDGNDTQAIYKQIEAAKKETEKPTLIIVTTHIGYGSPKQDSYKSHGSPLGPEDVIKTKEKLGWPTTPEFYVPQEALDEFHKAGKAGAKLEDEWNALLADYRKNFPDDAKALDPLLDGRLNPGWEKSLPVFEADAKGLATRAASGKVLNAVAPSLPFLLGGSADLNPSTNTELKGMGDFEAPLDNEPNHEGVSGGVWSYAGRNICFGVREHAMGSIMNGMAAHGAIIPFGGTFLTFSDYMRPAIRLASLMNLQSIYVFTHDSIALGEDGPTHQPIEHVASLRAIPHLDVIRPADANETVYAWKVAIESRTRPTALILSRQNLPTLDRKQYASAENLAKGAYILKDADNGKPDVILMASGSEVSLIVEAAEQLKKEGLQVRLVSFPSWELFEAQDKAYQESVLPKAVTRRLAVEAGVPQGWERYVGDNGNIIAINNEFGVSAPADEALKHFGFTADNVAARAKALVKQ